MYEGAINNRLLAELSAADLSVLRPRLLAVELRAGAQLQDAGSVLANAYFPTTATVSLTIGLADGAMAEVAPIGNEGVVGVCAFLSGGPALGNAVVQGTGFALRLPAAALRDAARASPTLTHSLMVYTQTLLTHIAQTSACMRHHRLDQQLCRWLLLHLDRLPGNVVAATHDGIAQLLGVRREGVTAGALRLQRAGLIRYSRGRIELCDRAGLEAQCCECYTALRHAPVRDAVMAGVMVHDAPGRAPAVRAGRDRVKGSDWEQRA